MAGPYQENDIVIHLDITEDDVRPRLRPRAEGPHRESGAQPLYAELITRADDYESDSSRLCSTLIGFRNW